MNQIKKIFSQRTIYFSYFQVQR